MLSLFLSFCGPINVSETAKEDGDLKAAGITKPKVDTASSRLCLKDILCWHWKSSSITVHWHLVSNGLVYCLLGDIIVSTVLKIRIGHGEKSYLNMFN